MSNTILVKQEGRAVILTLNRPDKLNALSSELLRTFHRKLLELDRDDGVGAIIVTGAGDRAFTAGMDLSEAAQRKGKPWAPDEDPVAAMEKCRKPIIFAINGLCITGGMELMLVADIIIASRKAKFADTHVRVGLMPGWGISQRLSRQIGPQRAKEISFSGNFFDAQRMYDLGVINRVVEPEELMPAALALARDFADADQQVVMAYKKVINDGFKTNLADGLELERERAHAYASTLPAEHYAKAKANASSRARQQKA